MDLQNYIIKKVGIDRLLHFFAAGWITSFIDNYYLIFFIALILGSVKEFIDEVIRKSKYDLYDLLATLLGGIATIIIKLLLSL